MTVVYTYDETLNHDGGFLPGVPLRDLTQDDLDSFPKWILPSIEAAPYFVAVAPLGSANDAPVTTKRTKKSED